MLWRKVERAVQCADAGIDGQDEVDTDPLSFRSQTVTRKTKENKNSEATIRIVMLHGLSSSPGVNH